VELSATRLSPLLPTANLATVSAALATIKSPLASTMPAVITFFPLTVAVDHSTTNPAFNLKSFVTVAILSPCVGLTYFVFSFNYNTFFKMF
jgi:hypothetical protein